MDCLKDPLVAPVSLAQIGLRKTSTVRQKVETRAL